MHKTNVLKTWYIIHIVHIHGILPNRKNENHKTFKYSSYRIHIDQTFYVFGWRFSLGKVFSVRIARHHNAMYIDNTVYLVVW